MATTTITTTIVTEDVEIPRGSVEANLEFYQPPADDSSPFNYVEEPPEGQPQRNYSDDRHQVLIEDIRGRESEFNLDRNAFQTIKHVSTASNYSTFDSEAAIKEVYYPEVEQLLLKNVPGAHKVIIFDHTIRKDHPNAHRQPVNRVHIDQTNEAAIQRVKLHAANESEANELLKGRYRIINVWRPLNGAVESSPLAFASAASVEEKNLVAIQHRYPYRTGEIVGIHYNAKQKWYYWSGQTNDESLLLKCSDSADLGGRVPHSAFANPQTKPGAKPRESIEVRALVFG
jgi:hypothetical protein